MQLTKAKQILKYKWIQNENENEKQQKKTKWKKTNWKIKWKRKQFSDLPSEPQNKAPMIFNYAYPSETKTTKIN